MPFRSIVTSESYRSMCSKVCAPAAPGSRPSASERGGRHEEEPAHGRRLVSDPRRTMRIATWNVNSLKARQPRVEEWLGYAQPDVLVPAGDEALRRARSRSSRSRRSATTRCTTGRASGTVSRSCRASASTSVTQRLRRSELVDPYEGDARLLAATCGGVRVVDVYVPNGREVGTEFYDRKLVWLELPARLDRRDDVARRADRASSATSTSRRRTATCGRRRRSSATPT